MFRAKRVWYIDNTAGLMCLIRGRSDSPEGGMIHAAVFALRAWFFWEWIPSKSNWSDQVSRLGLEDPWWQANHFTAFQAAPFGLSHFLLSSVSLSFFERVGMSSASGFKKGVILHGHVGSRPAWPTIESGVNLLDWWVHPHYPVGDTGWKHARDECLKKKDLHRQG